MKLLILGSGAMGSLFAGKLTQNGVDVTLFNRSNHHVEAIKKDGLKIIDQHGNNTTVKLPIITNPTDLTDNYDMIVVLVKTFATEIVLETVLPFIRSNTPILTLQNGIGNMEAIKKMAPQQEVFVGGTWSGASVPKPGTILHQAWGSTFIGAVESNFNHDLLENIASAFTKSGLDTKVSDNVQSIIWSKLLVNIAYNGLTAVTRLKNGDAIRLPEGKHILEELVNEAIKIAKAKNIPLLFDHPVDECIRLGEEEIGMNTSSMLSDILYERKTEIDAINGAIVEEGKKHSIPTPYNDMLLNLIKIMENSYSQMIHPK
ncbi:2-dehydropantoate 2-reductase [Ornithinibacillus sp. L9]|uniref:2-dehydropantoate 2-reductase n=1 Tax=Ornithinibacillus caprae TaxID=2678566 RepID=A0A6N8FDD1_9BACI|nr:2-dehydropantoate 2-reductase [Ornithinibacillus caprae]MUK87553.1 2-dehydropantoate 2-reductase [Ornithinibacillus caprae]